MAGMSWTTRKKRERDVWGFDADRQNPVVYSPFADFYCANLECGRLITSFQFRKYEGYCYGCYKIMYLNPRKKF